MTNAAPAQCGPNLGLCYMLHGPLIIRPRWAHICFQSDTLAWIGPLTADVSGAIGRLGWLLK